MILSFIPNIVILIIVQDKYIDDLKSVAKITIAITNKIKEYPDQLQTSIIYTQLSKTR